jgi:hypothetical protein
MEGFIVLDQVVEVRPVKLRDDTVNVFPADLRSLVDQVTVVWRDHHEGKIPDVVGEPLIFLFIEKETLALIPLLDALYMIGIISIAQERTMD